MSNLFKIFPGPVETIKFKQWILYPILMFSSIGLLLHYLSLKQETKYWGFVKDWHFLHYPLLKVIEEVSVHMFVAVLLFIALEVLFHNIDKWYGKKSDFTYTGFTRKIEIIAHGKQTKSHEIIIVNTFLKIFAEASKRDNEELTEFRLRTARYNNKEKIFIKALINAASNENSIKILLLDPFSFSARQRKEEIDEAIKKRKSEHKDFSDINYKIIEEIIRTINRIVHIYFAIPDEKRKFIEIKLYDRIPPFSLFKIKSEYNLGFYPANKTSVNADYWTFYESSDFSNFVNSKFNDIWFSDHGTCIIQQYLYISIYEDFGLNKLICSDIHFVDVYNKDNGSINENRILAMFSLSNQSQIFLKIDKVKRYSMKYREKTLPGMFIEQDVAYQELKNKIEFNTTEVSLYNYCQTLFDEKYPKESLLHKTFDKSIHFLQIIDQ